MEAPFLIDSAGLGFLASVADNRCAELDHVA
jgi:hypothetical protein